MPWRGPQIDGEYPTLGYLVIDWIEANCVIPDGEQAGEPFVLTDEQYRFVLQHYRLKPDGEPWRKGADKVPWHFRRSLLVRPQKWGKGPLSAAMTLVECAEDSPVVFDGWDAAGEPVGRPWATPWAQITALSEDQTDNVFRALLPMIELGGLRMDIPDVGLTRVNLPGGGFIEPVTASARSRMGQRITFAVQDETGLWTDRNGGTKLADNQRRNLAGMGGRSIETTNAWDPTEESVAQRTHRAAERVGDVHVDMTQPPEDTQIRRKKDRPRIYRAVYADSYWVPLDQVNGEVDELIARGEEAQAERFFGNRVIAGSDHAFSLDKWDLLATSRPEFRRREMITLGFDGARFVDSTALVATHVETGFQWIVGLWEDVDPQDGVPRGEVDAAVGETFSWFKVWRFYCDPPHWDETVDAWAGEYGTDVVFKWWTQRKQAMGFACRAYSTAIEAGEVGHDGDTRLKAHIRNARRVPLAGMLDDDGRPLWRIAKDRPGSPDKIDAAMAAILSWEARGDAIAAGVRTRRAMSATL